MVGMCCAIYGITPALFIYNVLRLFGILKYGVWNCAFNTNTVSFGCYFVYSSECAFREIRRKIAAMDVES